MRTRYILYCMSANTNRMKTKLIDWSHCQWMKPSKNLHILYCLQGGGSVRKRAAYHPPPQRDLRYVFDRNGGTKQGSNLERRFDRAVEQGTLQLDDHAVESIAVQRARFNRRKRKYAWLEHHSRCTVKRGKCKWEECPGWNRNLIDRGKTVRKPYSTHYKCVQCSMKFGSDHYFCNDYSKHDTRNCHDLYHKRYHGKDVDT